MWHEVLLALSGYSGDVFVDAATGGRSAGDEEPRLVVAPDVPVEAPEREALNRLVRPRVGVTPSTQPALCAVDRQRSVLALTPLLSCAPGVAWPPLPGVGALRGRRARRAVQAGRQSVRCPCARGAQVLDTRLTAFIPATGAAVRWPSAWRSW